VIAELQSWVKVCRWPWGREVDLFQTEYGIVSDPGAAEEANLPRAAHIALGR